jgi:2-aminoadipate transaminase
MSQPRFSFDGLFSQKSKNSTPTVHAHAKYDFAVAYPDPESLPLSQLVDSLKSALDREGTDLAYYADSVGLQSLRKLIAEKLNKDRNMNITEEDVVVTSGSGEAISMIIQALTDPGDVILTEQFVYSGTLNQMKRYDADVRSVPCDESGIITNDLEAVIKNVISEGKIVKSLYTIPTFQNPMGWTMPVERRKEIISVCQKYGVPIFEDDCYFDLRFEGENVESFYSLDDQKQTIYVGSFSKIIAPGMRLGYMIANESVRNRACSFKSGATNTFASLAVEEFLSEHMYQHIESQNTAFRQKRDSMLAALGEHLGSRAEWNQPEGGLYIWVKFPEGTDMEAFQQTSFNEGVGYLNGKGYSPEGNGSNYVRLCFGHATVENCYQGIVDFVKILEKHKII